MTDWLLALVPQYGLWLLAACTYCSCLAMPVPASILMLTAGGFVAAGDLSMTGSIAAALTGAVAGDQTGYFAGRKGGAGFLDRISKRAAPLAKARDLLAQRGGIAVFLSRWLLSPLGPYVNVVAGAACQPWAKFAFWGIAGEIVWVTMYVSLGYVFTGNIAAASAMAMDLLGFVAAGGLALGLAVWTVNVIRSERRR